MIDAMLKDAARSCAAGTRRMAAAAEKLTEERNSLRASSDLALANAPRHPGAPQT